MGTITPCPVLRSIFYARFHSERGPVVLRRYPRQGIFTSQRNTSQDDARLIHFNDISSYIIPPYELCNNALSIVHNTYSILGWPVSIEDSKYPRNRFTFNLCFVLDDGLDADSRRAWSLLVRKTARWLKSIEHGHRLLSSMNEDSGFSQPTGQDAEVDIVSHVLEQAFQQLSNFGECCVRVSDVHVLNLSLDVRQRLQAAPVHAWDVPLLIAELPDRSSSTWDLVLQQIHTYINGVNHAQRIAELADVELELVQSTLQALVSTNMAILLDIFHSQAVYAPTADMKLFIKDDKLLAECHRYILQDQDNSGALAISTDDLVDLYLSLHPGLTIAEFCLSNEKAVHAIDLRRMITFGVIKGILRRVHRYAQLLEPPGGPSSRPVTPVRRHQHDAVKNLEQAWKQAASSSGWATPPSTVPTSILVDRTEEEVKDANLKEYLDGQHCFDQICVEMSMTEKTVIERLDSNAFGEINYFMK